MTHLIRRSISGLLLLLVLVASGCADNVVGQAADAPSPDLLVAQETPANQAASIAYMREEEKLARDVYDRMYDAWSLPVFQTIADSERRHMQALLGLIRRFDLEDPVAEDEPGTFTDATLQVLYNELVAQGQVSQVEALRVAASIEELDIRDLQHARDTVVDDPQVIRVYENLLRGSRNHLRAFMRHLDRQGATYTPRYLSAEQFEEILSTPMERGGGQGKGRSKSRSGR